MNLPVCRDGVVGMVTLYGLNSLVIQSHWGVRFFMPVQTCPDSHPASLATGIDSFIVEVVTGLEGVPFPLLFA